MTSSNDVVRKQVGDSIKKKESMVRRLRRIEEQQSKDLAVTQNRIASLEFEVTALVAHLKTLGGPIEEAGKKPALKKAAAKK